MNQLLPTYVKFSPVATASGSLFVLAFWNDLEHEHAPETVCSSLKTPLVEAGSSWFGSAERYCEAFQYQHPVSSKDSSNFSIELGGADKESPKSYENILSGNVTVQLGVN